MLLSCTVVVRFKGTLGTLDGLTELLVPDGVLVPIALVAVTVKVYVFPFVRPVIVTGDEPLLAL